MRYYYSEFCGKESKCARMLLHICLQLFKDTHVKDTYHSARTPQHDDLIIRALLESETFPQESERTKTSTSSNILKAQEYQVPT